MSVETAVRKMCEKGGAEADILRVLAAQNGISWMSELSMDLTEMHDVLGTGSQPPGKEVEGALKKLSSEGLVSLDKRKRRMGISGDAKKDILVSVVDLRGLRLALARDEVYRRYSNSRYALIRDALEKKSQGQS